MHILILKKILINSNKQKQLPAIYAMHSNNFKVDLNNVQTNMVLMSVNKARVQIKDLQRRLQTVLKTDTVKCSVRCMSLNHDCVRFTFYWEVTDEDVRMAVEKIQIVVREYDEMVKSTTNGVCYSEEKETVGVNGDLY